MDDRGRPAGRPRRVWQAAGLRRALVGACLVLVACRADRITAVEAATTAGAALEAVAVELELDPSRPLDGGVDDALDAWLACAADGANAELEPVGEPAATLAGGNGGATVSVRVLAFRGRAPRRAVAAAGEREVLACAGPEIDAQPVPAIGPVDAVAAAELVDGGRAVVLRLAAVGSFVVLAGGDAELADAAVSTAAEVIEEAR